MANPESATSTPKAGPNRLRWPAAILLFAAAGLAIALPFASATLFTIAIGGVAIAAGIGQALRLPAETGTAGLVLRLLSALAYGLGGTWLLLNPVEGEFSLTLFMGLLLAFQGVMELAVAAAGQGPAGSLVLLDGIVTTLLGGMLIAEWPSDSLWAVGTLIGFGLAFSAFNLITTPRPSS